MLLATNFSVVMKSIKRQKQDLENERDAEFAPPSFYFSTPSSQSNSFDANNKVPQAQVTNSPQLKSDHLPTENQDNATSYSPLGVGISQTRAVSGPTESQTSTFPIVTTPSYPPPPMHNYAYFPTPPMFPPPPLMYPSHPPPAPPPPPPGVDL